MRIGRISFAMALSLCLMVVMALTVNWNPSSKAQSSSRRDPIIMPAAGISLRLTLGLKDKEQTDWSGRISLSVGRVVALETGPDRTRSESNQWTLSSTQQPIRRRRAKGKPRKTVTQPAKLYVTLVAPTATRVRVETNQGDFSFALDDLAFGQRQLFLTGAAGVEKLPLTRRITDPVNDDDFPAAATDSSGTVWCAYVSYRRGIPVDSLETDQGNFETLMTRGNGDQVRLIKFSGGKWSPPIPMTKEGIDVWRPAVAVDGRGRVHVVWSENLSGNWELQSRSYDPATGEFSTIEQLTNQKTSGSDLNVRLVGAEEGVWVAWQSWRNGNFDILLAKVDRGRMTPPLLVSTSKANDWHPALTSTGSDDLWIAWDTYDKGDYDVYVRRFTEGKLGQPIPIAISTRCEARPSLVSDGERLWIAYEDGDDNWGKDYGPRLTGKGNPLYRERNIIVRCLQNGKLLQTKQDFRSDLVVTHFDDTRYQPENMHRISFPRLGLDGAGRLWLLFRRHPEPLKPSGERWVSFATSYIGEEWTPQIKIPDSENLLDNQPALAPAGKSGLLIIHSSDGRTTSANSAKINNLHASLLDLGLSLQSPASSLQPPALVAADPKGKGPTVPPADPHEAENVRRMRFFRLEAGGKTYQLLRGEFHRHTEISSHRDWDGPLEEVWRYGLDAAAMDWIGPGDHDYGMKHEYMWWFAQKQIDLYHHAPEFVTMFTYERSQGFPNGHRNVMFAKRGIRTLPQMKSGGTPEEGSPDIKNLYAYLKRFGGICSSHTSATNMGTDWRDNDPAVEPVVEIFQGHRQNYEEPNAPLAAKGLEDSIQGYHPEGFVWQALKKGYRLGFQSSSDHVSTHTSYAILLAEEKSRAGILDAFKRRHCYAANDNILLIVRSGEHIMGDEFVVESLPKLEVLVVGTAPISRIDVVRQFENELPTYVYHKTPMENECEFQWTDMSARKGSVNMYYVRIQQQDGRLAWSSPMWVKYEG